MTNETRMLEIRIGSGRAWALCKSSAGQKFRTVVAQASRRRLARVLVTRFARAGDPCLKFGHFGLRSWAIATSPANRGAPKAPIIPAQPSGLGNRTGEAKALKARSISIPGIA